MNENIKNFITNVLLTIAFLPGALSFNLWYQKNTEYKIWLFTFLVLLAFDSILVYLFFGSKVFIYKLLLKFKNSFLIILSIVITIIFGGLLINEPETFQLKDRLGMFLISTLSGSYLLYKLSPFLSFNLTRSYLKEDLLLMDKWTATETTNEQQTDYREIPLNGRSLKKIIFTVRPTSSFWRAGIKLTDPNGTILPLRTSRSFIFHLGSTDSPSYFGITSYIDGNHIDSLNKTLLYNPQTPISIKIEIDNQNFIRCSVNDSLEYESSESINHRIIKKAFLAAWGDGHNMRVEFDSIGFDTK